MRNSENSTRRMPMFVLLVVCLLALVAAIAVYLYESPGKHNLLGKPSGSSGLNPPPRQRPAAQLHT